MRGIIQDVVLCERQFVMKKSSGNIQKPSSYLSVGIAVSCVLAVIIAVGYFFAMKNGYNFTIGHFDPTVWFFLLAGGVVAALVLSVVMALPFGKYTAAVKETTVSESILRVVAAVPGVAVFALFVIGVISHTTERSTLGDIAGVLSVFIPIALLLPVFCGRKKISAFVTILAVLGVNLAVFSSYFDFTLAINNPVRNLMTVARCALLLFFISEARFLLPDDSERFSVRFALFVNFFSFTALSGISLGAALYRITANNPADPSENIAWLALFFAVSLVSLVRILGIRKTICEKHDDNDTITDKGE